MTTTEPGRVRGTRIPARVKITCWMLGLMALVLATVVLVVWQLAVSGVQDRVNRAIEQETAEFGNFAREAKDPATGRLITDPHHLIESHLRAQYLDSFEVHVGIVVEPDGRLTAVRQGEPPYDVRADDALLRRIIAAPGTFGEVDTPGRTVQLGQGARTAPRRRLG